MPHARNIPRCYHDDVAAKILAGFEYVTSSCLQSVHLVGRLAAQTTHICVGRERVMMHLITPSSRCFDEFHPSGLAALDRFRPPQIRNSQSLVAMSSPGPVPCRKKEIGMECCFCGIMHMNPQVYCFHRWSTLLRRHIAVPIPWPRRRVVFHLCSFLCIRGSHPPYSPCGTRKRVSTERGV